jgi:hypothetical protein
MPSYDQLAISGLAEELVNELNDEKSLLSKHLDKTDFLGRKVTKNSLYTSQMNKNKSLRARLRKLIFNTVLCKSNANAFLKAYDLKFPEEDFLKPGKAFEKTINDIPMPTNERVLISESAIIVSFRAHIEAYNARNEAEYVDMERLMNFVNEPPFRTLNLTFDEEKLLADAQLRVKIRDKIINEPLKDQNIESIKESLNLFIAKHSSDSLHSISHLPLSRCEELVKEISKIKKKRTKQIYRRKYNYSYLKSQAGYYKKEIDQHEKNAKRNSGDTFGKFIAQRLNRTWFSVSRMATKKPKQIKRPIKEIDGNGKGWTRMTIARVIMELGSERYDKSDTSVLSKQDTVMGQYFESYQKAKQTWNLFQENFSEEDLELSKGSLNRLRWDIEVRVVEKNNQKKSKKYKEILRLVDLYKFHQPPGLRKICLGLIDCENSFGFTPYLSKEGLQYVANEMYYLYRTATKYRKSDLESILIELNKFLNPGITE